MSAHRDIFLDFSADESTAPERARRLREWLRQRGWAVPRPGLNDFLAGRGPDGSPPPADDAGPRVREFDPWADRTDRRPVPITVNDAWECYHAGGNTEGLGCRRCGAYWRFGIDELMIEWHESKRPPPFRCRKCGWQELAHSWNLQYGLAFCHLAVIVDIPGGQHALLQDLREGFGGQWVGMHHRL